jgi:hypothetical protein
MSLESESGRLRETSVCGTAKKEVARSLVDKVLQMKLVGDLNQAVAEGSHAPRRMGDVANGAKKVQNAITVERRERTDDGAVGLIASERHVAWGGRRKME